MSVDFITAKIENRSLFTKFRTITISYKKGISAVYGLLKDESNWKIQAYKFSTKKGWTVIKSKDWVNTCNKTAFVVYGDGSHILMCRGN